MQPLISNPLSLKRVKFGEVRNSTRQQNLIQSQSKETLYLQSDIPDEWLPIFSKPLLYHEMCFKIHENKFCQPILSKKKLQNDEQI